MISPELTHQNHFKFYYNQQLYGQRKNASDQWHVEYGFPTQPVKNFKQTCLDQALLIQEKESQKIGLLLSGGVDSEVVLHSFYHAGVPVQAYIGQMEHDYNIHDISYAVMICEKLSVPYQLIKYDFENMMERHGEKYAELSQCFSPQLINVMYLMDQIDAYPIIGGGDCLFVREESNEWFLNEKERTASWYRFLQSQNRNGCPGFFQYTPEIIYSYVNDAFIQDQMRLGHHTDSNAFKFDFYSKHFSLRSRKKYTGFEKIQDIDYRYRTELKKKYGHCDSIHKTSATHFTASSHKT